MVRFPQLQRKADSREGLHDLAWCPLSIVTTKYRRRFVVVLGSRMVSLKDAHCSVDSNRIGRGDNEVSVVPQNTINLEESPDGVDQEVFNHVA